MYFFLIQQKYKNFMFLKKYKTYNLVTKIYRAERNQIMLQMLKSIRKSYYKIILGR